jgi:dTDP-4-dehydrorhamnose 3,5-epimerase
MLFTETPLTGAFVIDVETREDDRGLFARTYCTNEFLEHGLQPLAAQSNLSYNHIAGTLRGMHYQVPPAAEAKLVRCTRGSIVDVIVDMRETSPTYLDHFMVELTDVNRRALYVPPLFAHGYQALEDDTEVVYQVSEFYAPDTERGLAYNDPALGIRWPMSVTAISDKDSAWPLFETALQAAP